jgi:hypothetical protein
MVSSGATTFIVLAPAQARRANLYRPGPDSSLPCLCRRGAFLDSQVLPWLLRWVEEARFARV